MALAMIECGSAYRSVDETRVFRIALEYANRSDKPVYVWLPDADTSIEIVPARYDEGIERALSRLGEEHKLPEGWELRVLEACNLSA